MIFGLRLIRKAAYSTGGSQTIRALRVFLSESVHKVTEPVTYVSHDAEDGAWQFLGDSMSDGGGPVTSCFHHPIDCDPSLAELSDLPLGWYAGRGRVGEPWTRKKHSRDDESK